MEIKVEVNKKYFDLVRKVISLAKSKRLAYENRTIQNTDLTRELYNACHSNLENFLTDLEMKELHFIQSYLIVGREALESDPNEYQSTSSKREYLKNQFNTFQNGRAFGSHLSAVDYFLGKKELDLYLLKCLEDIDYN